MAELPQPAHLPVLPQPDPVQVSSSPRSGRGAQRRVLLSSQWDPDMSAASQPDLRGVRRERGDPREMMRAINPREAELMDPAAGIHVRFRLGGAFFPPLVFYKVFTHRWGPCGRWLHPRAQGADVHACARVCIARIGSVGASRQPLAVISLPTEAVQSILALLQVRGGHQRLWATQLRPGNQHDGQAAAQQAGGRRRRQGDSNNQEEEAVQRGL